MKKVLLIAIFLLFVITSCKKNAGDNLTPVNTITATVDGVDKTFNAKVTALQTNLDGTNVLIVSGSETSETNSGAIDIEIDTVAAITTGTYAVKTDIPNGFNSGTTISYIQGYTMLYPSLSTGLTNSITISHISSTNVQGSFNATLFGNALSLSPSTKTFANGKFNVTITQHN